MKLKVLFTCAGRSVEIIKIFQKEGFFVYAADCDPTAPALHFADEKFVIPECDFSDYFSKLKYIENISRSMKGKKIKAVIPLTDYDLLTLKKYDYYFRNHKALLLVPGYSNARMALDKWDTCRFFQGVNMLVPPTHLVRKLRAKDIKPDDSFYPALLKPREGTGSKGIIECDNYHCMWSLDNEGKLTDYIIQKKITGTETTIEMFGDGLGNITHAVQRQRIRVRAGEVERGVTTKYNRLHEYALLFARHFKPFGPCNIQCIYNPQEDQIYFIEINPRFGGGYPLAYRAGANFPGLIKKLLKGKKIYTGWTDPGKPGVYMSRYDRSIFWEMEAKNE